MAEIAELPVGTYVTQKGYRLITKLLAADTQLEFTRAAVGIGKLQGGVNPESLVDLVNYKMDAQISDYGIEGDQAYVNVQLSSERIIEGFLVTEVGVYAKDPDEGEILYSYMDISGDPTYIYAEGTSSILKFAEFTMYMLIGSLKKVTAVIAAGSFVNKELFEETIKQLRKELKEKSCVIIGSAETILSPGETLFVVEDGEPPQISKEFNGAVYTDMIFSEKVPNSAIRNWAKIDPETIIKGSLKVSENADATDTFFAHINNKESEE